MHFPPVKLNIHIFGHFSGAHMIVGGGWVNVKISVHSADYHGELSPTNNIGGLGN